MSRQQPTIAAHASSAGHWYDKHGNQVLEVPAAKGVLKKVTLREARMLDLARGVTSVMGLADKPALNVWKQRQAILSALTLPRNAGETEDAWLARVLEDAGETARKAAEAGTAIHKAVQQSYQGEAFDQTYAAHVQGVRQVLLDIEPNAVYVAEKGVASDYGYGTKADLHSDEWVWDMKGREFTAKDRDDGKVQLYDEHHMQLAATRKALQHSAKDKWLINRCGIVFVSRTVPGLAYAVESKPPELARGWEMFRCLLAFQFAKDGWRPSWATKGRDV